MSAFSLVLDAYGADFPAGSVCSQWGGSDISSGVLALPHVGEGAKRDLREDR